MSAWVVCGGGLLSSLAGSSMQSSQHVGADKSPRIKQGGVAWFKLIISLAPEEGPRSGAGELLSWENQFPSQDVTIITEELCVARDLSILLVEIN